MHYDDGKIVRAIASDGTLRLEQLTERAEPIDGLATVTTTYGAVQGLPAGIDEGDVLMVSTLVGDYWFPSRDLSGNRFHTHSRFLNAPQMSTWFSLNEQSDSLTIEFLPSLSRFWPSEVIHQFPLKLPELQG